ncbi:MAG: hypothetical protein JWO77_176 [Ilumatobacteraceae bacterium]|nr:hypothetical protein [Ilumatobacteraceae bacterium]
MRWFLKGEGSHDLGQTSAVAQMSRHSGGLRAALRPAGAGDTAVAKVDRTDLSAAAGLLAEAELHAVRATTDAVLAYATDLVMFFHEDGTIMWASPASRRLFGLSPEALVGESGFDLVHPDDRTRVLTDFLTIPALGDSVRTEFRVLGHGGAPQWVEEVATNLLDDPDVGAVVGHIRDITERKTAEFALAYQANHDPLTGLANRRLLCERIAASLSHDSDARHHTALVLIDITDFKAVNDRVGHAGGDRILRDIGDRLASAATSSDTVARLAGDEFVICCEGVPDTNSARRAAERFRTALAAPFCFRSETLAVGATIGLALSTPSSNSERLLRDADVALFNAKQSNRQLAVFHDAMGAQATRHRNLITEFDDALAGNQIQTWFQPEIDLHTGELNGFEALARWIHPERGVIGPVEFIPLAEASGLIGQLGRQVLTDACRELARWMDRHPERYLTVSVNVSPLQMTSASLAEDVRSIIAAAGVPPGRVCLEVTESALMDPDLAAEVLRSLKEIGVLIAIDDFGTGYSSLSRLKNFPVDFLKVDRSFVAEIGRDPEDELIVAAVTDLAHSMGIQIIAEGIETSEQHEMLTDMGCEFGQGYLWSRPMPPAETLAYVERACTALPVTAPLGSDATVVAPVHHARRTSAADTVALLVHELASPLTIALGYLTLLQETLDLPDDSEEAGTLRATLTANRDMASILSLLSDLRPIEEGTLTLERVPVDVVPLLTEVIEATIPPSEAASVNLGGDRSAIADVDPARLRQILRNLLANAQKWKTTRSWVRVKKDSDRGIVTVSVFDDGPGVPPERIGDLFRRFARFDRTQIGTGLGLYISRALARAHGGDLRYRRAKPTGSEFSVELQLSSKENHEAETSSSDHHRGAETMLRTPAR